MAERDERLEEFGDTFDAGAGEAAGEFGRGARAALGGEELAQGAGLFGEGAGPGLFAGGRAGRAGVFEVGVEASGDPFGRALEVGAEPADAPRPLLCGARGVELEEAGEEVFVGERGGPAVGFGDRRLTSLRPLYLKVVRDS